MRDVLLPLGVTSCGILGVYLAADRDDALVTMDERIPIAVRLATSDVRGDARISRIEQKIVAGKAVYAVTFDDSDGRRWYVTFDGDGKEIASEGETDP